jgi:hypothetical protein
MEFNKCQGCQLLTSIPTAPRATLHHFEVAAVLESFQPRPPLPPGKPVPQRSFVHVVVTDWLLLLVSLPSSKQGPVVLLEMPLLLIHSMVRDTTAAAAAVCAEPTSAPCRDMHNVATLGIIGK